MKSFLVLNRCHTGKDFLIQERNDFACENIVKAGQKRLLRLNNKENRKQYARIQSLFLGLSDQKTYSGTNSSIFGQNI